MRSRRWAVPGVIALVAAIAFSCKSSPNQRTMGLGDVDTGPGSLEYVRRQLQGTWTLQQFETVDASGQLRPVKAQAKLTYDQYGNMSVAGSLLEPLPGQQSTAVLPMLQYSGRITIDTAKKEIRLQALQGTSDPALQKAVGPDLVRKYEITMDTLTLTFVDAQGKITGRTTFKRGG